MHSSSNPALRTNSFGSYRKTIKNYSYFLTDKIGKGYSSTVYIGQNDSTLEKVAIKVIELKFIKDSYFKQMLQNELQCMKKVKHPRILRLIDTYSTNNNIYIISQFCEGGDLQKQLKSKGKYKESELIEFLAQFYPAYLTLLEAGFIHRDLKPANILLRKNKIRIADFGIVKKTIQPSKDTYNIGTLAYMSPQSIYSNIFNQKTDVWSIGVMCYQLIHGKLPWKSNLGDRQNIKFEVLNANLTYDSSLISIECIKFLSQCLDRNPLARTSIYDMKNNFWFQKYVVPLIQKQKQKRTKVYGPVSQLNINKQQQISSSLSKLEQKQAQKPQKYETINQKFIYKSEFQNSTAQNNKNLANSNKKISFFKFTYSNNQQENANQQQRSMTPTFHRMRQKIKGSINKFSPYLKQKQQKKSSYIIVGSFIKNIVKVCQLLKIIQSTDSQILYLSQKVKLSQMLKNYMKFKLWQTNVMINKKENLFALKDWSAYQFSQQFNLQKIQFQKLVYQINQQHHFQFQNQQLIRENFENLMHDQLFLIKKLIEKKVNSRKQDQQRAILELIGLAEIMLNVYQHQRIISIYLNDKSQYLLSYLPTPNENPEVQLINFEQICKKQKDLMSGQQLKVYGEQQLLTAWMDFQGKIQALF